MFSAEQRLELLAPAKVNLFLEVLGVRANGYHELRSIVVPISVYDRLELEMTRGAIETTIDPASRVSAAELALARPDDNLATRAAVALKEATGFDGGVAIRLKKQIPPGGGMGGGSADAAAVLLGLNQLWGLGLSRDALMAVGFGLGCDVPALICGQPVRMEGLGEVVHPIETSWRDDTGLWLVVVNPGFCVPTGDIYRRYISSLTSGCIPYMGMVCALKDGDFETVSRGLFNSLQETVFRKYPLTAMVVEALTHAGVCGALLSGSGSSAFGIARDEQHAGEVAAAVQAALGAGMWTCVARILPDGVMAAHGPLEA